MTIAGSRTTVISAAYHGLDGGMDKWSEIAQEPLIWGVMWVNSNGVEHCGLSNGDVELPQDG
jgi:hypothetical protein